MLLCVMLVGNAELAAAALTDAGPAEGSPDGSPASTAPVSAQTPPAAPPPGAAQTADPAPDPASGPTSATQKALADMAARLDGLQQSLAKQQQSLVSQQKALADQQALIAAQAQQIEEQKAALAGLNAQLSQVQQTTADTLQAGDTQLTERLQYLEQKVNEQPDDPLTALADTTFPGSWRIPGTNAAMRIGGYVKMNIINSFQPLVTQDRFIVGSIPPNGTSNPDAKKGASVTAQQSRVNLDLRDHTDKGMLRAFVEGDFAGEGETFRLRHAYGQFGRLLAGKTWSTLMDVNVRPEEIDFEGINGMINVRQPQLRFFPSIGKNLNLRVSLEDPAPDITGGTASAGFWDTIATLDWSELGFVKGSFLQNWTVHTGLIGRQIQGQATIGEDTRSTFGWGVTFSGQVPVTRFHENDKIVWQVIGGEGIGRYINDLGSVGGMDAIFAPDGSLDPIPVFAGYLSAQHWWNDRWRSNATFSWVDVNTYNYQNTPEYEDLYGPPYEQTLRVSANLLFTPVRRLELGAELLWGQRKNGDGTRGDASQIQVSARYLY